MKHNFKRILSLFLVFVMIAGFIPIEAKAAAGDYTWTFEAGNPHVTHTCTSSNGNVSINVQQYANESQEGIVVASCTGCSYTSTKRVPRFTQDWVKVEYGDDWTGVYNGKPQTVNIVPADGTVSASNGDTYTYDQLISVESMSYTSAAIYTVGLWFGCVDSDKSDGTVDYTWNGKSMIYLNGALLTNHQITMSSYLLSDEEAVLGTEAKSYWIADGTDLASAFKTAYYTDVDGNQVPITDVKIFNVDYELDGTSITYNTSQLTDGSTPLTSVTEPGRYIVYYTLDSYATGNNGVGLYNYKYEGGAATMVDFADVYPASIEDHYAGTALTNPAAISPSSSMWNFYYYNNPTGFPGTPGTYHPSFLAMRVDKDQGRGFIFNAIDELTVTVKKLRVVGTSAVSATNMYPYVGTSFSDLGLPSTVTVYLKKNVSDETLLKVDNIPIIWNQSTYNPSSPGEQRITGTLDLTGYQFDNPDGLGVAATVTVREQSTANINWPDKTVEYTGSPISHEIPATEGVASVAYNYSGSGYNSSTPPTNPGSYIVTATVTVESGYAEIGTITSTLTITKTPQPLPDTAKTPVLDKATPTTITLRQPAGEGTYEYAILVDGNYVWQDGLTFTGLAPNTKYTFVQRLKETTTTSASETSDEAEFSTLSVSVDTTISADKTTATYGETITLIAEVEHSFKPDGVVSYQWYKDGVAVSGATNSTLKITNVADSGTYYCIGTVAFDGSNYPNTSDSIAVTINGANAKDLLPDDFEENIDKYVVFDEISYGEDLSNTNPRLDVDAILADYPDLTLLDTITVSFENGSTTYPTVNESKKGTSNYTLNISSTSPNHTEDSSVNVGSNEITVNPVELTVTANDAEITYGDEPTLNGVSYTGFVRGDSESVLYGTLTLSCDYDTQWQNRPASGTATIIPSGYTETNVAGDYGNYTFSYENGTLTVNKLLVTIAPDSLSKVYGDTDPAFTYQLTDADRLPADVQAAVNSAFDASLISREPGEDVGSYNYIVNEGSDNNFEFDKKTYIGVAATLNPVFTITAREAEVVWVGIDNGSIVATGENLLEDISAYYVDKDGTQIPLNVNVTKSGSSISEIIDAGYYQLVAVQNPENANYTLTGTTTNLVVRTAGTTMDVTFPTASDIFVGDQLGDSELTGGNGNGTYEWKTPDVYPDLGSEYYDVVFTPAEDNTIDYSTEEGYDEATGTITRQVQVTVKLKSAVDDDVFRRIYTTKQYDGTNVAIIQASDAITIQPGDDVELVISAFYNDKNVGTNKPVTATFTLTGSDADKYEVPENISIFGDITKADLTIKANDVTLQYGDSLGDTGVTVTGLAENETLADLIGELTYDYDGYNLWDEVPADTKTITVSGLTSENYNITYETGTLTVTKRTIVVFPDDWQYKFFGDVDPQIMFTVSHGLTGNIPESVQEEINSRTVTLTRSPGENVGNYSYMMNTIEDTTNFTWVLDDYPQFNIQPKSVEVVWSFSDYNEFLYTGEDLSGEISAYYLDINGNQIPVKIDFYLNNTLSDFKELGDYELIASTLDNNYALTNYVEYASIVEEYSIPSPPDGTTTPSDPESSIIHFPYATPILAGESLANSILVDVNYPAADGTFAWVDKTQIPTETGEFDVIFTPSDTNETDYSDETGYDAATGTITRGVEVEVLEEPISPVTDEIIETMSTNGYFDKLYDGTTNDNFDYSYCYGAPIVDWLSGLSLRNRNDEVDIWEAILGDRRGEIGCWVENDLISISATGQYASKDVAEDIPFSITFEVSGELTRLISLPNVETTGDIDKIILVVLANDNTINLWDNASGNGVTYPEEFECDYQEDFEVWYYGFVNSEDESVLGGTLAYDFNIINDDGSKTPYKTGYAADKIEIVPKGLTSNNYELQFEAGSLTVVVDNRIPSVSIKEVTDTTIEIEPITDGEYSIDGGETWQDSPLFEGLEPETLYEVVQRIPDPDNDGEYIKSPILPVTTLPAGETLPAPTIRDVTDTTIEVAPIEDGEYSIDGGETWQDNPIFDGLTPNTDYEVIQRVPNEEVPGEYIVSQPTEVTTDEADVEVPIPVVKEKDDSSIELVPIANGEYSNDGGETWQDNPLFDDLTPSTEYEIVQRVPDPNNPGEYIESDPIMVTTDSKSVPAPVVTGRTSESITLKPVEDAEYSKDNGTTWQSGNIFTGLTPDTEYTFVQRIPDGKGGYVVSTPVTASTKPVSDDLVEIDYPNEDIYFDDDKYDVEDEDGNPIEDGGDIEPGQTITVIDKETGEETEITIPERPESPDAPKIDYEDETLGTTPDQEYSPDGGRTWYPCDEDMDISDFIGEDILIRDKATDDSFASEPVTVTIPDRPEAPDVSLDTKTEIINTTPDMEYSADDGRNWYPCPEDMNGGQFAGMDVMIRYPATDDSFASEPTIINVPNRPIAPIVGWTDVSEKGKSNGTITGVDSNMEWSADGGITWVTCPNGTINGLPEGIYLVRVKATDTSFVSFATVVKIGVGIGSGTTGGDEDDNDKDNNKDNWVGGNGYGSGYDNDSDKNNGLGYGNGYGSGYEGDGYVNITNPSGSTCPSDHYTDINHNYWYHDAVDYTVANKFMTGINATEWAPNAAMTRSMFITVLYRLVGSPDGYEISRFNDISENSWCYDAVAWGYALGVTSGTGENTFSPTEAITYQQMATMLYNFCNAFGMTMVTGPISTQVTDNNEAAEYAKEALTAITSTGILNVNGSTSIEATGTVTRAAAAQVITNFCTAFAGQIYTNTNIEGPTGAIYTNPGVTNMSGVPFI